MNFIPQEIEDYALLHTEEEPELLKKLNRETHAKMMFPRMLSGHLQGRLLSLISNMVKPKRILEIGTYTGYSCICLSEGLQEKGLIHSIEINDELEEIITRYLTEAGIKHKVKLHFGDALKVIPALKEEFDLVFIDADKENYSRYYDLVFPLMRKDAILVADNVLWSGKVLADPSTQDADTIALVEFSNKIQNDNRVQNLLLPVRDGLMIVRKK